MNVQMFSSFSIVLVRQSVVMHRVTVISICCTFVLLLFVIFTLFQHRPFEDIQEERSNVTNLTRPQVAFCLAFHNMEESYSLIGEKTLSSYFFTFGACFFDRFLSCFF